MENKKQIINNEPSKWSDITYAAIQFTKLYFGFALFTLLLTLPTKAIWMLIVFIWNLF